MKTQIFIIGFFSANLAALWSPAIGTFCYMANYIVAPDRQWWGEPLTQLGVRLSLTLVLCTSAGMVLHWAKLRSMISGPLLHSQELLACAFTLLVVLSRVWGVPMDMVARDLSGTSVSPVDKMPKVLFFVLIMTHVLVTYRQVRLIPWFLVLIGGLYMGADAYTAIPSRYVQGRLDVLGGADFNESNAAASHLAVMSVLAGTLFLKSRSWLSKGVCVVSGAFSVNAIILTQCRGALVALCAGGIIAPFVAPSGHKSRMVLYVIVAAVLAASLTNRGFWDRAETIAVSPTEASAASRFDTWQAGLEMFRDNPLGVGAGGFYTVIGSYNPLYAGRDCHNTYIRCLAELGLPGGLLLGLLIANAFRILRRAPRAAAGPEVAREIGWDCFGFQVGLVVYLVSGITIGLTYIEELWWFLCFPVCLERAALASHATPELSGQGHVVRPIL